MAGGSTRVVVAALLANAGIAIVKGINTFGDHPSDGEQVFEQMRSAAKQMTDAGQDPLGTEGALYIDAIGSGVRIEGSSSPTSS